MPTANPFRIPSVPRAPVAPMQRSLFGASMFNRRRRPPAQEGPFAPPTPFGVPTNEELDQGPFQGRPEGFRLPPGPAPFTPTGGPPMPPVRDEWTEEEEALKNALIDTLPKVPVRDKEGKIINNAQGDPVMTANPLYLDYTARLRQLKLARSQRQQVLGAEQRQTAPVTKFSQRPFGGFAQGRYSQQLDPLTGALVGPETFLGGEPDPAALARDRAQQLAAERQGADISLREKQFAFTQSQAEQARRESERDFAFRVKEAEARSKEAIDAAVAAETQTRLRSFTAEVARNRQDLYGSPFSVDPEQASARAINAQNAQRENERVMAARNRQALYPAALNAIKLLQSNPQALRDDQKAALLRDFAPLFDGGVEEAQGLDLGALWAALQPLRGFGFAQPSPAVFAGRR